MKISQLLQVNYPENQEYTPLQKQNDILLQKLVYLSVVIPAKNESIRLPGTLIKLNIALRSIGIKYEIIVVNDGSSDNTSYIAKVLGAQVISNTRSMGIAAAFRAGAKISTGEVIMLCPADIEDFSFLNQAISASKTYDVISVSKRHPESTVFGYGKWRWFMSNNYHRLICIFFGKFNECTDTHYIKLYDGSILRQISKRCIINGPVGETEIMLHARNAGSTFHEVPAKIVHTRGGSKTSFRLVLRTASELLRLWIQKP
jgi:dolichyl-phosphate beta-glucosyltransferase